MWHFLSKNFCIISPLTPSEIIDKLEPQVNPGRWGMDLVEQFYSSPDEPLFAGQVGESTFYIWNRRPAGSMGYGEKGFKSHFKGSVQPYLTGSKIKIETASVRAELISFILGYIAFSLFGIYVVGFQPLFYIILCLFGFVLSLIMAIISFNISHKKVKANLLNLFGGKIE